MRVGHSQVSWGPATPLIAQPSGLAEVRVVNRLAATGAYQAPARLGWGYSGGHDRPILASWSRPSKPATTTVAAGICTVFPVSLTGSCGGFRWFFVCLHQAAVHLLHRVHSFMLLAA